MVYFGGSFDPKACHPASIRHQAFREAAISDERLPEAVQQMGSRLPRTTSNWAKKGDEAPNDVCQLPTAGVNASASCVTRTGQATSARRRHPGRRGNNLPRMDGPALCLGTDALGKCHPRPPTRSRASAHFVRSAFQASLNFFLGHITAQTLRRASFILEPRVAALPPFHLYRALFPLFCSFSFPLVSSSGTSQDRVHCGIQLLLSFRWQLLSICPTVDRATTARNPHPHPPPIFMAF